MKIKKLYIKNFQSHLDTKIEFHPGFSVLQGASNKGKSAIFRSIRFLIWDYWNKRYVRTGAKNSELEVEFDTGDTFKRIRGANNEAIFNNANPFKSFGDVLPQQLKDLLKIPDYKIDIDKELNVNVSSQQDPLFLISPSYSAPLVSKFFSRLSGIHIIDSANRNIDKDKKKQMESLRVLDEIITQNSDNIKKLENVFEWKKIVEQNEALITSINEKKKQIEYMENLYNRIFKFNQHKKLIENEETKLKGVNLKQIFTYIEKCKQLYSHIELFNKFKIFNDKKQKIDDVFNKLKHINISKINKYILLSNNILNCINLFNKIIKFNDKMKDINSKIEAYGSELIIINQQKQLFIKTMGICPLCGTRLK